MAEERTVRACPRCGSTRVQARVGGKGKTRRGEERYRCEECGHLTDDLVDKQTRTSNRPGNRGLAKVLSEVDPDAVGGGE